MEWSDDGIVLAGRRHGETAAVVSLLTREHGRHAGLVRGFGGRRNRGVIAPGNHVRARWRGRLQNHLGSFHCELTRAVAALLLADGGRLAALAAACAVAESALPERDPQPRAFAEFCRLLEALETDAGWPEAYVRWEVELLAALGFGLDLAAGTAADRIHPPAYLSAATGRPMTSAVAEVRRERLLRLPAFVVDSGAPTKSGDVADGLALTGHFLQQHVYGPPFRGLPAARRRLAERFSAAERSGLKRPE
jgi:DNA repair protein RecO (recombination protein O)